MTKKTCPLGEDCDLTVAWMAGRESAKDEAQAMVVAALEEASYALMECAVWCDSQERVDDGWRNGVADARKHISRHIYIGARAAELKEDQ